MHLDICVCVCVCVCVWFIKGFWFGWVWFGLVGFYGVSTFVGYLMPNPVDAYISIFLCIYIDISDW